MELERSLVELYFWKNFWLVYDLPAGFNKEKVENSIIVPDFSSSFFKSKSSPSKLHPEPLDWKSVQLPVLFSKAEVFFVLDENGIECSVDLFGNVFFWLSGYQEWVDMERDTAGRYLFSQSFQKKWAIGLLPIVNVWMDILREAIENHWNVKLHNKFTQPKLLLSHDIDEWASVWKQKVRLGIEKMNLSLIFRSVWERWTNNHWARSMKAITQSQQKWGYQSIFFFLPNAKKWQSFTNADYPMDHPSVRYWMDKLKKTNVIGWHGSFYWHQSAEHRNAEALQLSSYEPIVYRSHYLVFTTDTISQLEECNIQYDSTLGFADAIGWRNGTSYPFYLFDFGSNRISNVIEIPLFAMDATVFYPKYMGMTLQEMPVLAQKIKQELQPWGGIIQMLWHNTAFDSDRYPGWEEGLDQWLGVFTPDFTFIHPNDLIHGKQTE